MKRTVTDLQEKVLVMWTLHIIFMSLKYTALFFTWYKEFCVLAANLLNEEKMLALFVKQICP